jgi:nucleoside-diphosphate-sugar epimerase
MSSTYLITGGAGFIGSHLSLHLLRSGHTVKILDNFSSRSRAEFEELMSPYSGKLEIIEADIRDRIACKTAVADAEFVLHHAAMASVPASIERPNECTAINVDGTNNLLEEVKSAGACERFVFASSSAVYGDLPPPTKVESARLEPLSPYASSKLLGEVMCRDFAAEGGAATVSLRYFNVFGPRQDPNGPYAAVIPRFIECIREGTAPTIFGDGEQSRDFVSVRDIVSANMLACESSSKNVSGLSFNIGSGVRTTLNDLVKVLSHIIGREVSARYMPARAGDVVHSLANIMLAKELLGFSPSLSFEVGLRGLIS